MNILPILACALMLCSCQSGGSTEPRPATAQQVQDYKQILMEENYSLSYHSYCPYVSIEINERTPKAVREQITAIACDYEELTFKKRQLNSDTIIAFSMPNRPMGVSALILQEGSTHPVRYSPLNKDAIDQFTAIFPDYYHSPEPPKHIFCEKLSDMLRFYQLKLSNAEQVVDSGGELSQLIFTPKEPIKGQRFSKIIVSVNTEAKGKITHANIDEATSSNITFSY